MSLRVKLILQLLLGVFFSNQSHATVAVLENQSWVRVTTKDFVLMSDASEKKTRALADKLILFRSGFEQITQTQLPVESIPVTLIITQRSENYEHLVGKFNAVLATTGMYYKNLEGHYAIANIQGGGSGARALAALFHEYSHHLVALSGTHSVPYWYAEGLAEFLSTAKFSKRSEVLFGAPRRHYLEVLRKSQWINIEELLTTTHISPTNKPYLERFYALSWLLVSYAYSQVETAAQLRQFLKKTATGIDVTAAFSGSFKMDYADLTLELRAFAESARFRRNKIKSRSSMEEIKPTKILSSADALYAIGDYFQYGLQDQKAAQQAFERVVEIDQNYSAALARLAIIQDDLHIGEQYLKAAQALSTSSSEVLMAGGIVNRRKMQAASNDNKHQRFYGRARENFQALIEQQPEHIAAHYALGTLLAAEGEIAQATSALESAYTMSPNSNTVREALIQLYFFQAMPARAEKIVESMLQNHHLSPGELQRFTSWVEQQRRLDTSN